MKKLRNIDNYKFIERFGKVVHCRVFSHEKLPQRVFVEYTKRYKDGKIYRVWYCPTVSEYKGHKTIMLKRRPKIFEDYSGCAGLSYWFAKYGLTSKKQGDSL